MKNIIEVIEAKLQEQKDELFVKDLLIQDLKDKLKAAEKEKAELITRLVKNDVTEIYTDDNITFSIPDGDNTKG